jgi:hypothetical protein
MHGEHPRSWEERAAAANRLRAALVSCEQDFPEVLARERAFVCRNIAEAVAVLTGEGAGTCVTCGRAYSYDLAGFLARGFAPPRRCYPCRQARKAAGC